MEVQDMVKEYEAQEAARDAAAESELCNVPKEEMEPSREGEAMVKRGRLNPETGQEIPLTAKARTVALKQFGVVSEAYKTGYTRIFGDK